MGKFLIGVLSVFLSSALRRLLLGAGIGLFSSSFILTILNHYINSAVSSLNSGSGSLLGLIGLSGLDVAISVVIGALVTRATIASLQLTLRKLEG